MFDERVQLLYFRQATVAVFCKQVLNAGKGAGTVPPCWLLHVAMHAESCCAVPPALKHAHVHFS
jgi:hypothetical protein